MNELFDRLIGAFVALVVLLMLLPVLARLAQKGLPVFVTVAIFLVLVRLLWPTRGRRR